MVNIEHEYQYCTLIVTYYSFLILISAHQWHILIIFLCLMTSLLLFQILSIHQFFP